MKTLRKIRRNWDLIFMGFMCICIIAMFVMGICEGIEETKAYNEAIAHSVEELPIYYGGGN